MRGAPSALVAVLAVALLRPGPAAAQAGIRGESLLERWTLTWFSEGWAPRWMAEELEGVGPGAAFASAPRFRALLSGETLRLGSDLDHRTARLDLLLRQPLGNRFHLIASASSGLSSSEAFRRPLAEEPRSEAVALGVGGWLRRPDPTSGSPAVGASFLAGWDGGAPGFRARLGAEGAVGGIGYGASLVGWTTTARDARYFFPADSLNDIGVQHEADGAELAATVEVGVGRVRLRPEASWRVEIVEPAGELRSSAFLYTSLGGRTDAALLALAAEGESRGARVAYRERRMDMDSGITRSAIAAGWVSYARLGLTAWRAEGWTGDERRRWTLSAQRDRSWGETSVRVETWPFVGLWEALTLQAYRLDGEVTGRAATVALDRRSLGGGWSWGVLAARYEVRVLRESWYVTSFGFGRTDEESTLSDSRPVWFAGASVERPLRIGGSTLTLGVAGQVPVHREGEAGDSGSGGGGGKRELSGYLGVRISWAW